LSSGTAALNALATLSLAGSPPPQAPPQTSTSFASAVGTIRFNPSEAPEDNAVKQEDHDGPSSAPNELSVGGVTIKNGSGKKRGTTYQCESCSKVCSNDLFLLFNAQLKKKKSSIVTRRA
jgi:hypothetical protein